MDAGLATGVASLTIQLFSGTVASYRALANAFQRDADLAILACKLELEEQRFLLWGTSSGIDREELGIAAEHVSVVLNSLKTISSLVSKAQQLVQKNVTTPATTSDEHQTGRLDSSAVQRLSKSARWILDHRSKLESILRDLKDFNDSLNSLLSQHDRLEAGKSFQKICIKALGTEKQSKLALLEESTLEDYRDVAFMAALRKARLQLDVVTINESTLLPNAANTSAAGALTNASTSTAAATASTPGGGKGSSAFDDQWIINIPGFASQHPGDNMLHLNRSYIYLEWKKLPAPGSASRQRILQRLQFLTTLLGKSPKPADFCVLDLRGFAIHPDQTHLALVFDIPPAVQAQGDSYFSLQDILTSKELRKTYQPALQERYRLALRLCRCVLMLHTAGWLHKAIRPSNVIFFPTGEGSGAGPSAFDNIYLVGFECAREDGPVSNNDAAFSETLFTETEWQFYEHPHYQCEGEDEQRRKYTKLFDIYR
jgi:hypothetical protein